MLELVRRAGCLASDKHGFSEVSFPDGSSLELWTEGGLESNDDFRGCTIHLRRNLSAAALDLVWSLARDGGFTILNAQGHDTEELPLAIVVTSEGLDALRGGSFQHPMLCNSAEHLGELLFADIGGWRNFRTRGPGGAASQ